MSDVFSQAKRSEVMARIRGRGNEETEQVLARLFRKYKISGWRLHLDLPGRPDFTFPKSQVVVFVDGCFWHRCPLHSKMPRNNRGFWKKKLSANVARDKKVTRILRDNGWHVVRIWEHDLSAKPFKCVSRVSRFVGEAHKGRGSFLPADHASSPAAQKTNAF